MKSTVTQEPPSGTDSDLATPDTSTIPDPLQGLIKYNLPQACDTTDRTQMSCSKQTLGWEHRGACGIVHLHRQTHMWPISHMQEQTFYGKWSRGVQFFFSVDHCKSETFTGFGIFPVKKTQAEIFQKVECLVCGFMPVPNILQASHSATDLCCLNPAVLHSCQTTTGGGQAACVCVCEAVYECVCFPMK